MLFCLLAHLFVDKTQMRIQNVVGRCRDRMAEGLGNSAENRGGVELHEQCFGKNVGVEEGLNAESYTLDAVRCLLQDRFGIV